MVGLGRKQSALLNIPVWKAFQLSAFSSHIRTFSPETSKVSGSESFCHDPNLPSRQEGSWGFSRVTRIFVSPMKLPKTFHRASGCAFVFCPFLGSQRMTPFVTMRPGPSWLSAELEGENRATGIYLTHFLSPDWPLGLCDREAKCCMGVLPSYPHPTFIFSNFAPNCCQFTLSCGRSFIISACLNRIWLHL